jgi:hypothetical protein
MWFNGTAISNKAQRALRNENVTIVAHPSGCVHCLYEDATIDKNIYQDFARKLASYLSTELSLSVFASFLRTYRDYQKYFQVCRDCHGQPHFLKAEVLFHYEHGSNYQIADKTYDKLLAEVSDEDFVWYELPGRIRCDKLDELIRTKKIDLKKADDRAALKSFLEPIVPDAQELVGKLSDFLHIEAKLPALNTNFLPAEPIKITVEQDREDIIDYLQQLRKTNTTADLAFYAYRDMQSCDWTPFVKAAVERNPVSIKLTESMSLNEIYSWLESMDNASIYDGERLAQPDEVANYKTGDGLEKAFLLANIIRSRNPEQDIEIVSDKNEVILKGQEKYRFESAKGLEKQVKISAAGDISVSD